MIDKELNILGRKIVWLFAHPDDECYLAAGTIYENYRNGGENYLICATAGEQGICPSPERPASLERFGNGNCAMPAACFMSTVCIPMIFPTAGSLN